MRTSFFAAFAAIVMTAALFNGPTAAQDGGEIVASGSFKGASSHVTNGNVTIRRTADGVVVVLEDDFDSMARPIPSSASARTASTTADPRSRISAATRAARSTRCRRP